MTGSKNTPCAAGLRSIISIALGVLFIYAAFAKLIHIYEFEKVVDAILATTLGDSTLPLPAMRVWGTAGVIAIEVMLGMALILLYRSPRLPGILAAFVLSMFTVVLVVMAFMESPPSCGCFGSWDFLESSARTGIWAGIIRNAGLGVLACWLVAAPSRSDFRTATAPSAARASGFTLIEVVVSIVVVLVLVAIALPGLRLSRDRAKKLALLSEMRQALAGVFTYTEHSGGFLPYLARPEQPELGAMPDSIWHDLPPTYFRGQAGLWPTTLHRMGIDLTILSHVYSPRSKPQRVWTWFWMTHAAHARPEYWVGSDIPDRLSLYQGVRLDETTFPSAKGLLIDVAIPEDDRDEYKAGFADGSAGFFSSTNPPAIIEHLNRPFGAVPWRILTTEHGIRGRDFDSR